MSADSPTILCAPHLDMGERRPMRARVDGVPMCSSHYNKARYTPEQRHPKAPTTCDWCTKTYLRAKYRKLRYGGKFCSYPCRDAWRLATGNNPSPSAEARAKGQATRDSPCGRARAKLRKAARGTSGWRWVAGPCQRCGSQFVSALGAQLTRYCSDACANRARGSRRRARERGAHHEPYSRAAIFERDGYRCHLCRKLTIPTAVVPHPRAPVIDHLIPLGPGDDAAYNVATACFMCNSKRREVGAAQLILFG